MKIQTLIKLIVMCSVMAAILVLDLVTKYVFDASLIGGEIVSVIPKLFNFKLVHNMGAAGGMLAGKQVFLIAVTIVFLAIFIFYYVKEKNKTWLLTVAFGFIFGGCIGNLYDRIFLGFVRDFIQFDFWQSFPTFNFADVFLCIGVALFIIYLIIYYVKYNKNNKKDQLKPENKGKDNENWDF